MGKLVETVMTRVQEKQNTSGIVDSWFTDHSDELRDVLELCLVKGVSVDMVHQGLQDLGFPASLTTFRRWLDTYKKYTPRLG